MSHSVDYRNYPRFKVQQRAYTRLEDEATPYHVALILDISLGGMAFSYLGASPIKSDINNLDIIVDGGFSLTDLQAKIVSDIAIPKSKIASRRCGVAFVNLSSTQEKHIETFIGKYTEQKAPLAENDPGQLN